MIGIQSINVFKMKGFSREILKRLFRLEYSVWRHFILDCVLVSGLYRAQVRFGNRNRVTYVSVCFGLMIAAVYSSAFIWMTHGSMPQRAIPIAWTNKLGTFIYGTRDK